MGSQNTKPANIPFTPEIEEKIKEGLREEVRRLMDISSLGFHFGADEWRRVEKKLDPGITIDGLDKVHLRAVRHAIYKEVIDRPYITEPSGCKVSFVQNYETL